MTLLQCFKTRRSSEKDHKDQMTKFFIVSMELLYTDIAASANSFAENRIKSQPIAKLCRLKVKYDSFHIRKNIVINRNTTQNAICISQNATFCDAI